MADRSKIEWTDASWNPIVGCSIVSPGCTNCYAMKMAARLQKMNRTGGSNSDYVNHYDGTTRMVNGNVVWTGKIAEAPASILLAPLHRKKPTTYFVNSMGDLFHEDVPDKWIDQVFVVMALCPQHTFQVLTKRAARMRGYLETMARCFHCGPDTRWGEEAAGKVDFPLPNVWLGVSAERQEEADERREPLRVLAAQGWTTFVSYEPALGPMDWSGWEFLRWMISGGEGGQHARPSHPDWHRAARDFGAAHDIAYFFKQWGEWVPSSEGEWRADDGSHRHMLVALDGRHGDTVADLLTKPGGTAWMRRVGKRAAGRLLDGVEHNGFPKV